MYSNLMKTISIIDGFLCDFIDKLEVV